MYSGNAKWVELYMYMCTLLTSQYNNNLRYSMYSILNNSTFIIIYSYHRGVDREVDCYDTSIVQCLTGWFGEEHSLLRYNTCGYMIVVYIYAFGYAIIIHVQCMWVNCIHCVC